MRKISAILCAICLLAALFSVEVGAAVVNPYFQIWTVGISETGVQTSSMRSFRTLQEAYNAALDGQKIGEIRDKVFSTADGITVTKDVTLTSIYNPSFQTNATYRSTVTYTGTASPFFTVANGGKLTLASMILSGNTNSVQKKGGLIRVENGGTLRVNVDPYQNSTVTLQNAKLNATDSKGGALYVENGATLIVEGIAFQNNSAASGANYYFENGATVIWDLNGDNTLDIRDIVRLKRHLSSPSVTVTGTADCNTDGVKNAADLPIYKQFLLEN